MGLWHAPSKESDSKAVNLSSRPLVFFFFFEEFNIEFIERLKIKRTDLKSAKTQNEVSNIPFTNLRFIKYTDI